ncbi:type II secretion system F family protein [Streptantibioticus ferralitis]|uniref:Type II secretion system F family protein n=1 Tax=Streptantibioticus ferralitis TaxID=236510 RepID=A0ABT5Z798_9ACTN|nr:type II secretion system F family protein [Streptantibioticus ferralitis]MDF2259700.1 type II secretion system F family protein [Streptantibioticus ferralitis]
MSTGSDATLAAVCGLAVALGGAGAVLAVRGRIVEPGRPARISRWQRVRAELPASWRQRGRWHAAAIAVAVVATWAYTGYPMQGLIAGLAMVGLPFLLHPEGAAGARPRIERLEALAQMLNQLAAVHKAGSTSLDRSLIAAVPNVPPVIRADIGRLAARLEAGWSPPNAYRAFADEQADGVIDHVMLLFQSHWRNKGSGLAAALEALATGIAQQAAGLRDEEARRAGTRKEARLVSLIFLGIVAVCTINGQWVGPYDTWYGQILLGVFAVMFVGAFAWLRRMARPEPEPRLFAPAQPAPGRTTHPASEGGVQ